MSYPRAPQADQRVQYQVAEEQQPGTLSVPTLLAMSTRGAKIFNLLPDTLRNKEGDFDLFKKHLDIFLSGLPDQPTVPGLARAPATKGLLDQLTIFF